MTLIGYNKSGSTLDPVNIAGTVDVDIKTLGGSLVPAGPLPVDIGIIGTVSIVGGTMDVTCSTVHTDAVATSLALADDTSNTQKFWIDTADDQVFYPVMNFGYDGTYWDRLRTTQAVAGGTITTGLLASDHVVRRTSTTLIDSNLFQGTLTSACSADWNVTDFNKLGLMVTLASTGTPTDIRITAEFKDQAGTYYIYQNDFWGDLRWSAAAMGPSTIHECVMGDLPVGTLRVCAYTQGTSTVNQISCTIKGQVYTW